MAGSLHSPFYCLNFGAASAGLLVALALCTLPLRAAPPPLLPRDATPAADTEKGRLLTLADALEPLAAARGVPIVVDLLPILAGLDSLDDHNWDLVHPNDLGSSVIASAFAPAIEAAAAVPEPSTALLLGAGLLAVAVWRAGPRRLGSASESP